LSKHLSQSPCDINTISDGPFIPKKKKSNGPYILLLYYKMSCMKKLKDESNDLLL